MAPTPINSLIADKTAGYEAIVQKRKSCRLCEQLGLTNPAAPELIDIDGDQIGPWTRWLGDLHADLMIVGQEWGDVAQFRRQEGIDIDTATNKTLRELLEHVGLDVSAAPGTGASRSGVYLTNAALCLKRGGAQALVNPVWFGHCAPNFLRPQIELVCPRVVVALGEQAYIAIMTSFAKRPHRFRSAVDSSNPVELTSTTVLVPVYHCGSRILNTHRNRAQQFTDWIRVRTALARNDIAKSLDRNDIG